MSQSLLPRISPFPFFLLLVIITDLDFQCFISVRTGTFRVHVALEFIKEVSWNGERGGAALGMCSGLFMLF